MHTIDTMGKTKSKKWYLDFKSNTLFMLLKNKSLILSMVTLGFSDDDQTIRFKKVYLDLISKSKDNNSLQHMVAVVNMKNPQWWYAQAFVRQGKFLWNFGLNIENDFDQAREDLKNINKYISISNKKEDVVISPQLEINTDFLNTVPVKKFKEELDGVNNPKEKEDIGENSNREISIRSESMSLGKAQEAKKVAQISLYDDHDLELNAEEDSDNKDYDSEEEIIVKPTKRCKKNYTRFIKSVNRGVTLGLRKGIKEAVDNMDLSFLETTSDAISYIINH